MLLGTSAHIQSCLQHLKELVTFAVGYIYYVSFLIITDTGGFWVNMGLINTSDAHGEVQTSESC